MGGDIKTHGGARFRVSETWTEFVRGTRNECIVAAVRTIRASKIAVTPRSGFAVGNVGRVKDVCLADKEKHWIRVIHEAEADNPAHAAVRGWPRDNDPLLQVIAEDAWSETILNKDVTA